MSELAARNEVMLLAHELDTDVATLDFLTDMPPADLKDLRELVSAAVFAREEHRFHRIAALGGVLPAMLTVKIAQIAFGPVISARIAGVLPADEAVRLARLMPPTFLAEIACALDPRRVEDVMASLPSDLVIRVGKLLLAQGRHLVLGRFIAVVPVEVALEVASAATAADLLQIAIFCEDKSALEPLVDGLDDNVLRDIITVAANGGGLGDTLTLMDTLPAPQRGRLIAQAAVLNPTKREALLEKIVALGCWAQVLPGLPYIEAADLSLLVNVPALLDVTVIEQVLAAAREIDAANALVPAVISMDDAHIEVVAQSSLLSDQDLQQWLIATSGMPRRLVQAALDTLTS